MITEKEVTYTKLVKTYHCDFCNYHIQNNKGCCGVSPIMECGCCTKHVCGSHRNHYQEDGSSDYDDIVVCDSCNTQFGIAWAWAMENAGRHDDIVEVALKYMNEELENGY